MKNVGYFALAALLVLFGMIAILSIGTPFLLTGCVMFGLAPVRHRRPVFWALLPTPMLFALAYLCVAPWRCTVSAGTGPRMEQRTACSALFGEYSSQPSRAPALMIGLITAAVGAALIYLMVARHERHDRTART